MTTLRYFTFLLFSVSTLAFAQERPENNLRIKEDCRILVRRKFTKTWSNFNESFPPGTPVSSLGKSTIEQSPALIFEVGGPKAVSYKIFEFKAPTSCLSNGRSKSKAPVDLWADLPESPLPNEKAKSKPASSLTHWFSSASFYQQVLHFKDATTGKIDEVDATVFGICGGKDIEFTRGRVIWGLGLCLAANYIKGVSSTPTTNQFEGTTFAIGINVEPYFLYRIGQRWALGAGIPNVGSYAFWSSESLGEIVEKFSLHSAYNLKTRYFFSNSSVELNLGLSVPLPSFYAGLAYQFTF